nr:receptor kinase-like protein Xa21 isoform X3 [Oryza sativa Japonica Group]
MAITRLLLQLLALPSTVIFLFLAPASRSIDAGDDLHALLSFRSHIAKDHSDALSSWSVVSNGTSDGTNGFCSWRGVTCSSGARHRRVVSLRVQGLGLVGTISPLVGNLTGLRELDLSDNKLEGEIPPSLARCLALQRLNLSVNFLSGVIPPSIGQLSKLEVLNIRHNNISGYVPSTFANLTALTMFSIADNYVHGQIPSWLGNLTALESFNIAGNMMRGSVPEAISQLTNLEALTISGNGLEEALEYLHHHISPSIAHCDIKPSNVLLDKDMTAHIGDFSLARIMSAEAEGQCLGESSSVGIKGTIGYLAPEYGMGTEISREGDIYSYGVLLLEMLTGRRPTDTMFHDDMSLPKYVEMAYPDNLLEIMDNAIPQDGNSQDIVDWFIAPISRIGLACCRDSASQRMRMNEVVKELSGIKEVCESKFEEFYLCSV